MPTSPLKSHAQLGNQAAVQIGAITGSSGTETFVAIGDLQMFDPGAGSRNIIDVSTLLSTAKEKLGGLADFGKANITCNYLPSGQDAGQTALATAFNNGYPYDFKIVLAPNPHAPTPQTTAGDTWSVSAIVASYKLPSLKNDQQAQSEFGLEFNGPVTFTAGT